MKRISHLMLSATLVCCAAAAQAATTLKAADVPYITNGGTGFIGVTESAGMKRQPVDLRASANGMKFTPLPAGEASTIVNGLPNVDPNVAALMHDGSAAQPQTRTMGGSRSTSMNDVPAHAHRGWGTPD